MAARKKKSRKARTRKPRQTSKKQRKGKPAPGEKKGDKTLAERLVEVRKRLGLTRVAASQATGINYESLSGYELGQEHPPFRRIRLLAIYYGCSLDYLAGITDRLVIRRAPGRKRRR